MFHAISARLARLARRTHARLFRDQELATWYGWQTTKTGLGSYQYRDPRFDQLALLRTAQRGPGKARVPVEVRRALADGTVVVIYDPKAGGRHA